MKKIGFILLPVCFLFIAMTGCEKEEENSQTDILKLGDVVFLNFGETVTFLSEEKDSIAFSFTQVKDWRGSDCLGNAFIELLMQQNNEKNNISIEVHGCSEDFNGNFTDINIQKDTLNYLFTVLQLNPRPSWEIYPSNWYKLKFKVEKL